MGRLGVVTRCTAHRSDPPSRPHCIRSVSLPWQCLQYFGAEKESDARQCGVCEHGNGAQLK
jgi:hypothetical protein